MPTPKNPTHLFVDSADRVIGSVIGTDEDAERAHRGYVLRDGCTIAKIATADVATLARIAAADCPALTKRGGGFIGAGTHPAQPYLEAMLTMVGVGSTVDPSDIRFGMDDPRRIIITFLGNAATWRGETARTVKARLKEIAK
jgi:hypothetical protein